MRPLLQAPHPPKMMKLAFVLSINHFCQLKKKSFLRHPALMYIAHFIMNVGCQEDVIVESIKYFSEDECKDIKSLPLKDNTFIAHFIINARCC